MPSLNNMATTPNLSPAEALAALEERTQAAQHELAGRLDVGPNVLRYLAENGAFATRCAVAANMSAPADINHLLADDVEDEVRVELARKIARLMPGMDVRESREVVELTIATLEKLARDQVPRVRAMVAEEIKHLDCVPKNVVELLARDTLEIVSAPILEYSPLLSDNDLLEIITAARIEGVLSAIAKRQGLSEAVSDAIVASLDVSAVATLIANADASIRKKTLDRLAEEAQNVDAWQRPLALRPELSQRAIKRIAQFVGKSILDILMQRSGLDEDTRDILDRNLRRRLEKPAAPEISQAENAAREIDEAQANGKLDDRFVEDAAEAGRREVVIAALSLLARAPKETVRQILLASSGRPVTALVWRAGLGMRASFKIQTSIMRLSAREMVPARNGVLFPMTEEEMRWQLGYFDIMV